MPCGYDLARTLAEASGMRFPAKQVWAVNGSAYFSRPGPRLVDGVEILAHILGRTPPLFEERGLGAECSLLP